MNKYKKYGNAYLKSIGESSYCAYKMKLLPSFFDEKEDMFEAISSGYAADSQGDMFDVHADYFIFDMEGNLASFREDYLEEYYWTTPIGEDPEDFEYFIQAR